METLAALSKEALIALVLEQAETLRFLQARIQELEAEIASLKNGGKGSKPAPPDWVKQNAHKPASEKTKKPRKKRSHHPTWHRQEPTQVVEHACSCCPDCGRVLSGGWEYCRRQIVEMPAIALEVIDHVLIARHCGVCAKVCVPRLDGSAQAVGASHFGVRLQSLVAYLRTVGRLPVAAIQKLLDVLVGLRVSQGQICEWLHQVAQQGASVYEGLQQQLQGSG